MNSPYRKLPPKSYWRTAVAEQHPLAPLDLYRKKFSIAENDRVATAGSCFAQHIARYMKAGGFSVLDVERAPPDMPESEAQKFGYRLYSGRFGNIYTTRQLLQLAKETLGLFEPQEWIWERNGRFYDALRPSVEPNGLSSPVEVIEHRKSHLRSVRTLLKSTDIFIFTMGLTEAWQHSQSGTVYPTAPGTIAGDYNASVFSFVNFGYTDVLADFVEFKDLMQSLNPRAKFLVTVSPVPLTATASGNHVLPATVYSKSVLRAVAGELYGKYPNVDYFPSYEIIASHPSKGFFFEANMRSVADAGVAVVMKTFFSEHEIKRPKAPTSRGKTSAEIVCEEQLLEAFVR